MVHTMAMTGDDATVLIRTINREIRRLSANLNEPGAQESYLRLMRLSSKLLDIELAEKLLATEVAN